MCAGGGSSGGRGRQSLAQIRGAQGSATRRSVAQEYQSSKFTGGYVNLTRNIKPPKAILDRAAFVKGRTSRGIGGFNRNSPANRVAYGSGFRGIGMQPSKGKSRVGRFSVNNKGDIYYRGNSGKSYRATHQMYGLNSGQWRIGGAAKYQRQKLTSEAQARTVYNDFGKNFDKDPMRGKYYGTQTKRNKQTRVAIKDEGGARRSTRAIRGQNATANSNSRFKRNKRVGKISNAQGSSLGSVGTGVNISGA